MIQTTCKIEIKNMTWTSIVSPMRCNAARYRLKEIEVHLSIAWNKLKNRIEPVSIFIGSHEISVGIQSKEKYSD
jgi:hypothetical protein